MLLEHSFAVPVPVDRAWDLLLDIEQVAPCMPGATLTSHEGDAFTGTVKVKLGPVNLTFKGSGRFVERDETAHRVLVTASGTESRGGGTAMAKVTAALRPDDNGGTRVEVATELDITGKAAQFGRGLIGDVSAKLVGQFADCLAGKLSDGGADTAATAGVPTVAPAPATAAAGAAAAASSGAGLAHPIAPDAVVPPAPPLTPESTAPAAIASGGRVASGAGGGLGAGAASGAATGSAYPTEVEPIDLLQVAGVSAAVRRAVPYVLAVAAAAASVAGVVWWLRRR